MTRRLNPDRFIRQLEDSRVSLQALYVISGDETLLVNECADALRAAAGRAGFEGRQRLSLDARSDWSDLTAATQSLSLFDDRSIITVSIASGRPGRQGGEALQALAQRSAQQPASDHIVILLLPRLDRNTRNSKWAQALWQSVVIIEVPNVERQQLPQWIRQRLAAQGQSVDEATLSWLTQRVEGNLLAAFQEIQKLALLYPKGPLSDQDVAHAVMNVARYNVFSLRDAILAGNAQRALRILRGLQAEGEALALVLWAIGDDIRLLMRLSTAQAQGNLQAELRHARVFGSREALIKQALGRVAPRTWPAALSHAHDIDRLIKGVAARGRMHEPWAELAHLALRVAQPQ